MTRGLLCLRCAIWIALVALLVAALTAVVPAWPRLFSLWVTGRADGCSLSESLDSVNVLLRHGGPASPVRHLGDKGRFALYETALGKFWVPIRGETVQHEAMIRGLVREQLAGMYDGPTGGVRKGDVVIDCGANVGTFTRYALNRGARKVIMVEPSPENIEALRLNFSKEISRGIVDLREVAVWDSTKVLTFYLGFASALDSAVFQGDSSGSIRVEAQTLDTIAAREPEVNFIKVDIEGAEARAVRGAGKLLARSTTKPRLAFDVEITPLDTVTSAVRAARPDYRRACDCQYVERAIRPAVAHFY